MSSGKRDPVSGCAGLLPLLSYCSAIMRVGLHWAGRSEIWIGAFREDVVGGEEGGEQGEARAREGDGGSHMSRTRTAAR